MHPPQKSSPTFWHYAGISLALTTFFYLVFGRLHDDWNWAAVWEYRAKFVQGWFTTLLLAAAALILSAILGLALALAQRSRFLWLKAASQLYVGAIRSTPLLVQILIFFYVVADALHLDNRWVVGILILACFSAAYVSEIVRASLETIPTAQWESARALGLTTPQTYQLVILPQALRQALPSLTGQFVSLIKDSSLLSVIGISELTLNAQEVNAFTYSTLESYLPLALGYLLLTLPLSLFSSWLEKRLRYDD